jgi:hypothetical protein
MTCEDAVRRAPAESERGPSGSDLRAAAAGPAPPNPTAPNPTAGGLL